MFSLFLPRCAAREQDLHRKHQIYYGLGYEQRFERAHKEHEAAGTLLGRSCLCCWAVG